MTDIKKDFGESFNLLVHRKKIIIPTFFAVLIPLVLIFMFLNISGITPLLKELSSMNAEFEQEKREYLLNTDNIRQENYSGELINYVAKDSENSKYDKEFAAYLEERGYNWDKYKHLINANNIILLIVFLLIGFIARFYLTCMSYAIIALNIKMEDISLSNVLRTTNRFLFKFLSAKVIIGFIVIAPILIIAAMSASLFFLNKILGILSIIIFTILIIIYIIVMTLRLLFVTPSMYMDYAGPMDSVKHSIRMTKGHMHQIFMIFVIIYGLTLFLNSFISQPLTDSYSGMMFATHWFKVLLNTVIIFVFLVAESFIFSLENVFLFHSYMDFKELDKIIKR